MNTELHGVFYTDGGCQQDQKVGGWGLHGYIFNSEIPKQGTGLKDWWLTPQGYLSKKAEITPDMRYDYWPGFPELARDPKVTDVNVIHYVDGVGGLLPHTTNNSAELAGVVQAFEKAAELNLATTLIYTDSKYVQEGYTDFLNKWQLAGWLNSKGRPIANVELWKRLIELKDLILLRNGKVRIGWVKGHNGNLGNHLADFYATQGTISAEKGFGKVFYKQLIPGGYWNPKAEINRLLANSRWYFNTSVDSVIQTEDGKWIYYLGEHGKDDDFLGKRMPDATFSVVHLTKPEPVLEKIRSAQMALDQQQLNTLLIGRLDFITRPAVYNNILQSGAEYLQSYTRTEKADLYTADKIQLTKELRPPRLAYNLVEILNALEMRLIQALKSNIGPTNALTDITALLYTTELKGAKTLVKLRPQWTSAVKSFPVTVNHTVLKQPEPCEITLTFGLDLPDRNALSALAGQNPQVHVLTWQESAHAFRYATILSTVEDRAIYAGFFANLHLML